MQDNIGFLRAQAAKCRRLAKVMSSPEVARTLSQMAVDYEARAEAAEKAGGEDPGRPA